VVLVPQEKDRRERDIFFRTALSDASGRFNFRTVIPGEYRVYSWEDAAYGAWMDPDFMKPVESKGEAASVGDGAQVSVQLNLIPAAQ
jgi:hypothetical protein